MEMITNENTNVITQALAQINTIAFLREPYLAADGSIKTCDVTMSQK